MARDRRGALPFTFPILCLTHALQERELNECSSPLSDCQPCNDAGLNNPANNPALQRYSLSTLASLPLALEAMCDICPSLEPLDVNVVATHTSRALRTWKTLIGVDEEWNTQLNDG
ncbi:hypothetical protein AN958_09544 [Leucoagaricus sp. SymC.cos]|nr:hypothetical protein AN958_09544 [Leucoagaricus sp. SymC.cos]